MLLHELLFRHGELVAQEEIFERVFMQNIMHVQRFAVRHEFARSTADVLARRSRLLFLDAALAAEAAPAVAALVAEETGRDPALEAFAALAAQYRRLP